MSTDRVMVRAIGCFGRQEWARQDSNLHRTGYEPEALTVELRALNSGAILAVDLG